MGTRILATMTSVEPVSSVDVIRPGRRRVVVVALVTVTVGLVLADSAIVTLALPQILRHLGGTVSGVAWVLISYNLVLALLVVPAARLVSRRNAAALSAVGIAVFAGSSAACALAGSIGVLIAARSVQAVGGALVVVAGLELLVTALGERRGVGLWIGAGVIGTAAGPVAGGVLTEAISWQAIFVVQVPFAVLAVPAALALRGRPEVSTATTPVPPARHRPEAAANLALALLSAALTAALFLVVLLLVEGWRRSPLTAALTVSVVPIAAVAAAPIARWFQAGAMPKAVAGCLFIAGGLGSLALPPSSDLGWMIAPQVLVGLGLGLTVDALTARALRDRLPRALHGGWTMAARHAGVVLGLVILTPVFTADLRDAQVPAQGAIASLVLDAPLAAADKIALAQALGTQLSAEAGRVPDLHPAFAQLRLAGAQKLAAEQLEHALTGQLERAASRAFRDSFGIGALLALAALIPLVPFRRLAGGPAPAPDTGSVPS